MSDVIVTGIFTIIGVIIGSFMSFFTVIYSENKNRFYDVQKIRREIIVKKMSNVNRLIEQLPNNDEELNEFKNHFLNKYKEAYSETDITLEMLYLTNNMQKWFRYIDNAANNDIKLGCDYKFVNQTIICYRNILIKVIQSELCIKTTLLQAKRNIQKTKIYLDKEVDNLINTLLQDEEWKLNNQNYKNNL
ncbi:MAG: hypothetical protein HDQ99_19880 [Lachnospiraceae bacterium]|nr:hypothetical protein [Lachnospiraceae bacterium]